MNQSVIESVNWTNQDHGPAWTERALFWQRRVDRVTNGLGSYYVEMEGRNRDGGSAILCRQFLVRTVWNTNASTYTFFLAGRTTQAALDNLVAVVLRDWNNQVHGRSHAGGYDELVLPDPNGPRRTVVRPAKERQCHAP
jgi:hypothetical protein